MAIAEVAVGTTPTVLFPITTRDRHQIVLDNQGDETVYIGDEATVTISNGVALEPGEKAILDFTSVPAKTSNSLAMWGIVEISGASVRVWTVYR